MDLRKKTIQSISWSLLRSGGHRLISLAVFIVLARLLEPEAFGLVALAGVFIAAIELFMNIGLADAIIQRRNIEAVHFDTAFWLILAIGGVCTIGSIGAAGWIAFLFDRAELAPVLRWLSLSIFLVALTRVQEAILHRELNFKAIALRVLVGTTAGGMVGIVMALKGYGVWSLVGQQLAGACVGVVTLWAASPWRPKLRYSTRHLTDLFGFGVHVMGANVMHFVNQQTDRLLIGFFLGPVALGYYTVGQRLILSIQEIMKQTFPQVLYSTFSRLQDDQNQLYRFLSTALQVVALAAFPAFMFLAVTGPEIVHVIYGARWLESAPVVQMLAIGGLLEAVILFNEPVFKAKGKPSWVFKLRVVRAVLGVVLFAGFVRWGIPGVAAAWVLRAALVTPISLWLVGRLIAMDVIGHLRPLLGPFLGALAMALSIVFAKNAVSADIGETTMLLGELVVASVVYMSVIMVAAPSLVNKAITLARQRLPVKRLQEP